MAKKKLTTIPYKNHSWFYDVYRGAFTSSNHMIFGYVMCLLFSLLFMQYDIVLGLFIFFMMALVLTIYYFVWGFFFFIFDKGKR